ncbi:Acyl-coenzyme A thioesterase 13 [Madurella mycetomatis]|uniref:Acyl-coenzyme A thioesterase 13 n=1 Tax=Madurella mycetomatis TaxID=100816 RepID=A0A175W5E9_9PEZI|nr:Acyl-coenzyme A thioesterase 13 [Madurella mycetomatis]
MTNPTKPQPQPGTLFTVGINSSPSERPISTLDHVKAVWSRIRPHSAIYNIFLSGVRLVSASPEGRILAHLDLLPVHLNSKRILHGAVSATLCDWAGGMAIAAATGLAQTGVSTDMHLSYVSTAGEGDTLEIEAWVTRAGRNLGFTRCEIRKGVTTTATSATPGADGRKKGPVVAEGSHTKYLSFGQVTGGWKKLEGKEGKGAE